ncbi:MAG: STAS/SEC14 domain-containing protein, partial [Desulfococcaceae bacterium]
MYQYLSVPAEDVLAYRITGEITEKEAKTIAADIDRKAEERGGPIGLLLAVDTYPSLNSDEDLYADLRFVRGREDAIRRMAVLGQGAYRNTWVALFGLFSRVETAYFERTRVQAAVSW